MKVAGAITDVGISLFIIDLFVIALSSRKSLILIVFPGIFATVFIVVEAYDPKITGILYLVDALSKKISMPNGLSAQLITKFGDFLNISSGFRNASNLILQLS
ncbi:hypothetical protein WR164_04850 [Philodulcilactobacillus myokoensis]|uniref:Uncharacterized protein n=1 Tax=Philodulcilactobacillus myokoensis TaxID=2929573 RepID=A0A9W6ERR4_9LACO|nr:hypothetical protein [Philodulcilactobacillus myokoensis]GLB46506.1 hypothetical protein WR164_04850 [Philodulcilactobacillus myokoensis]